MKVPEFINRRLPCPNEFDIETANYLTEIRTQNWQLQQKNDADAANLQAIVSGIMEIRDSMEEITLDPDNDTTAELEEIKSELDKNLIQVETGQRIMNAMEAGSEKLQNPILGAIARAGEMACTRCGGVIVNSITGAMYCGREAPEEIIKANQA